MKLLRPMACDFMVYKDYKINLICLSSMWNQLQDPTPPLLCYQSSFTIHHNISLKSHICKFSHCIFHPPLIIHFFVNDLLLSKLIQIRQAGYLNQKWSHCTLWWCLWWLLQALPLFSYNFDVVYSIFFASSNSDVLFIYY